MGLGLRVLNAWIPFQGLCLGLFLVIGALQAAMKATFSCQQQLGVAVAVWGHYTQVQVQSSVLCPNDPRLKACPGNVRLNSVFIVFCLFKCGSCWKMLLCGMCVQTQQCSFFCLLFRHLSLCLFFLLLLCLYFFFFFPSYFISSIKSYLACECAGAYCAQRAAAQRIPEAILFPLPSTTRLAR